MQYNRFLPLITPLAILIFLEIFYFKPKSVYVILVIIVLLYFFICRQFLIAGSVKERLYNILILPSYFTVSLVAFSTMIPREGVAVKLLIQLLFVVGAVFIYLYFRLIYNYLNNQKYYQHRSLSNLSSCGNFLSFYFISSAIYGFQSFLNSPVWLLMVIFLFFACLIVYQMIWSNKIKIVDGILYILIFCVIVLEVAWAASFLTLKYYIIGLIISIFYYTSAGLIKYYLLKSLNKRIVKLYLLFGILCVFFTLFTARWI